MSSHFIVVGIGALGCLPCIWALASALFCLIAGPPQCQRAMVLTISTASSILASGILWLIAALEATYIPLIFVADAADLLLALAMILLSKHDEYDSSSWPLAFGYAFISIVGTCWYVCFAGFFPLLLTVGVGLLNMAVTWVAGGLIKYAIPSLTRLYALALNCQAQEDQRRHAYHAYELPLPDVRRCLR
ncbi:MAG TPA: hypothetical protein VFU49_11205 [Ktedonobacteraceae bacterium]|nr:hypothetical protein [Ktedonobacteraceae bacterium]